jgi:hypothetical protein
MQQHHYFASKTQKKKKSTAIAKNLILPPDSLSLSLLSVASRSFSILLDSSTFSLFSLYDCFGICQVRKLMMLSAC